MECAIWKYEVPIEGARYEIPKGSQPLAAQLQGAVAVVWMSVPRFDASETVEFWVQPTGHGTYESFGARYIGTYQQGGFVGHVFMRRLPNTERRG